MRISTLQKLFGFALAMGLAYIVGDYYQVLGGENLYPLHGSVRLDGRPLTKGMIQFFPVESDHNRGGGGEIINGDYVIPDQFGLPRGKYQVYVSSLRGAELAQVVEARLNGEEPSELKEEVPERYNAKSEIYIDLTKGNLLEVDFDLK